MKALREPGIDAYDRFRLGTVIVENEEFYVYERSSRKFYRSKASGYVNVSGFKQLCSTLELQADIVRTTPRHIVEELGQETGRASTVIEFVEPHFDQVWTNLENARALAEKHRLFPQLSPLLDFHKVFPVAYLGKEFYEFFAVARPDVRIRILREKIGGKVNLKGIINLIAILHGENRRVLQRKLRVLRGATVNDEQTLLNGIWVSVKVATYFAREHGVYDYVKEILFDTEPSDAGEVKLREAETILRQNMFLVNNCFQDFELDGCLEPDVSLLEISVKLRISPNNFRNFTVTRRLKDAYVNASSLFMAMVRTRQGLVAAESLEDPVVYQETFQFLMDNLFDGYHFKYCRMEDKQYTSMNGYWIDPATARSHFYDFKISTCPEGQQIGHLLSNNKLNRIELQLYPQLQFIDDDDIEILSDVGEKEQVDLEAEPEEDVMVLPVADGTGENVTDTAKQPQQKQQAMNQPQAAIHETQTDSPNNKLSLLKLESTRNDMAKNVLADSTPSGREIIVIDDSDESDKDMQRSNNPNKLSRSKMKALLKDDKQRVNKVDTKVTSPSRAKVTNKDLGGDGDRRCSEKHDTQESKRDIEEVSMGVANCKVDDLQPDALNMLVKYDSAIAPVSTDTCSKSAISDTSSAKPTIVKVSLNGKKRSTMDSETNQRKPVTELITTKPRVPTHTAKKKYTDIASYIAAQPNEPNPAQTPDIPSARDSLMELLVGCAKSICELSKKQHPQPQDIQLVSHVLRGLVRYRISRKAFYESGLADAFEQIHSLEDAEQSFLPVFELMLKLELSILGDSLASEDGQFLVQPSYSPSREIERTTPNGTANPLLKHMPTSPLKRSAEQPDHSGKRMSPTRSRIPNSLTKSKEAGGSKSPYKVLGDASGSKMVKFAKRVMLNKTRDTRDKNVWKIVNKLGTVVRNKEDKRA